MFHKSESIRIKFQGLKKREQLSISEIARYNNQSLKECKMVEIYN